MRRSQDKYLPNNRYDGEEGSSPQRSSSSSSSSRVSSCCRGCCFGRSNDSEDKENREIQYPSSSPTDQYNPLNMDRINNPNLGDDLKDSEKATALGRQLSENMAKRIELGNKNPFAR